MNTRALLVLLIIFLFSSCEKELDELNENPNAPEKVAPEFLLSNVLWEAADHNTRQGWLAGNLLAQLTADLEFLPVDRYQLGTNAQYWDHLYHLMNDLKRMRKMEGSNAAYDGVGMIMEAWIASQLTDMWTRVPYDEALGADEGDFTPGYDPQRAIYMEQGGILDLLKSAVEKLENSSASLRGDIMYDGNLDAWIRFANSLRVRYLIRVSGRANVSAELQELVSDARLMESNADNAIIPYTGAAPNQWFLFNERVGRYKDVRMSATVDSVLDSLSDPRVKTLFKPVIDPSGPDTLYRGIPNGLSRESQTAYDLGMISLIGGRYRDRPDGVNAQFMRYSELQFALAEAAHKGLIGGSPSNYYQEGIQASFAYYGQDLPSGYLSDPDVNLNGSNDLKRIMTQKWIALFLNGHEAWFNIRRTGYPELPIPKDDLNGDRYPVRYLYPESEQAVNGRNYQEAVSAIGGDTYNSPGWWEE